MKQFFILLLTLLLASCAGRQMTSIKYIGAPEYDEPWNTPTISHRATDYKFSYAGTIGPWDRGIQEDSLDFPSIPGLVHKAVYAMCPVDICVAEYAVIALRCPQEQPLLDWMSEKVCDFANNCPVGNGREKYMGKAQGIQKKSLGSAEETCQYYMDQLGHLYDDWVCSGEGDPGSYNEQSGLLIVDCWRAGGLCTFYRADWYDWMSCGDNTKESYITVNAKTGKEMHLEDLVRPEKFDDLSALVLSHLTNGKGEAPVESNDVLARANGCGLIREGLIIYCYPYNLGCGADGQYNALIPYEELDGILK